MEVRCASCEKLFRVPEEKVSGKGIKFSCTRCGAVIIVKKDDVQCSPRPATFQSPEQKKKEAITKAATRLDAVIERTDAMAEEHDQREETPARPSTLTDPPLSEKRQEPAPEAKADRMEVRCSACEKLFRVPYAKISGKGVKFACTRCGTAIKITREEFEQHLLSQATLSALDLAVPKNKPLPDTEVTHEAKEEPKEEPNVPIAAEAVVAQAFEDKAISAPPELKEYPEPHVAGPGEEWTMPLENPVETLASKELNQMAELEAAGGKEKPMEWEQPAETLEIPADEPKLTFAVPEAGIFNESPSLSIEVQNLAPRNDDAGENALMEETPALAFRVETLSEEKKDEQDTELSSVQQEQAAAPSDFLAELSLQEALQKTEAIAEPKEEIFISSEPTQTTPASGRDVMPAETEPVVQTVPVPPTPAEIEKSVPVAMSSESTAKQQPEESPEPQASRPVAFDRKPTSPRSPVGILVVLLAFLAMGLIGYVFFTQYYKHSSSNAIPQSHDMASIEGMLVTGVTGTMENNGDILIMGTLENKTDKERNAWLIVVEVYDTQGAILSKIRMLNGKQLFTQRDYQLLAGRGLNIQDLKERNRHEEGMVLAPKSSLPFSVRYVQPPQGVASFNAKLQPFDPIRFSREIAEEAK